MTPTDVSPPFLFIYDSFNDLRFQLLFPFPSSLLPSSTLAPGLFLKAVHICTVGCHSSYRDAETFKSTWIAQTLARRLRWAGVCRQEENKWLLAELIRTQIKHRQFTASAPAVLTLCEIHLGLNQCSVAVSTESTSGHLFTPFRKQGNEEIWKLIVTFWVKHWDYCWNQTQPLIDINHRIR